MKWYEKGWVIALFLIFLAPVGIIFVWLKRSLRIPAKLGLTAVGLLFFAVLVSSRGREPDQAQIDNARSAAPAALAPDRELTLDAQGWIIDPYELRPGHSIFIPEPVPLMPDPKPSDVWAALENAKQVNGAVWVLESGRTDTDWLRVGDQSGRELGWINPVALSGRAAKLRN